MMFFVLFCYFYENKNRIRIVILVNQDANVFIRYNN
jgi:hypothetical protein